MWNLSILAPKRLSPTVATIIVALSAIAFGFMPLFAKTLSNAGLASPAITFYRYLLAALLLSPTLSFAVEKRRQVFLAISAGVAVAFGWIAYIEALKSAPVATVGLIYMTSPLFTLLIGALWLRQVPSLKAIFAGLLIVVAAFIALSPASVGSDALKPLLLSFLAPLSLGYVIVVLSEKLIDLTPLQRVAGYASGATLGLLPLILSLDSSVVIPSRLADWMLIFVLATAGYLLPQVAYVVAAPFIGSARAAAAESTQLPTMFLVGWLAFGEQITLLQCVAGVLVVVAISITPSNPASDLEVSEEAKKSMPPTKRASEGGAKPYPRLP